MPNFLDLFILAKLGPDATINTFCMEIGSSFFETASYVGAMQTKGLVRIEAGIGRSVVSKTADGEGFLQRARDLAAEPLDELDFAILRTIASGAGSPEEIGAVLNVFEEDIALHLWRLVEQGYVRADVRNVKVTLSLTESGFKLAGPPFERPVERAELVSAPAPPLKPTPLTPEAPPHAALGVEEQIEEAIIGGPDIAATALGGAMEEVREEEVEFTPFFIFRAKLAHYLRKFWISLVALAAIAVVILVLLALRTLNYI